MSQSERNHLNLNKPDATIRNADVSVPSHQIQGGHPFLHKNLSGDTIQLITILYLPGETSFWEHKSHPRCLMGLDSPRYLTVSPVSTSLTFKPLARIFLLLLCMVPKSGEKHRVGGLVLVRHPLKRPFIPFRW